MARTNIPVKGSIVKLKAVGGTNTEVEVECIDANFTFSWGNYDAIESKCHKDGVNYDRSLVAKFDSFDVSINGIPNDKADATRVFLRQALWLEAGSDFDVTTATGDKEFTISKTYTDANANVITLQGFITSIKSEFNLDNFVTMVFTFQQTKAPSFA